MSGQPSSAVEVAQSHRLTEGKTREKSLRFPVRGTPVFHMSKSFRDDPKGYEGDWKFSHPA